MLQANVSSEYNCLYGEPTSLCPKPDILLIKSGTILNIHVQVYMLFNIDHIHTNSYHILIYFYVYLI